MASSTSQSPVPSDIPQRLAGGFRFTEGPVWTPAHELVFSDIPADRLYRWTEENGIEVFREPSGKANGNTLDREGRLVTCEHWNRRVTRTEADGTIVVLADGFDGKKFNSPNDVVVKSDGTVWFTDPTYGLEKRPMEQDVTAVYRLEPESGQVVRVAEGFDQPNGLVFSADEKRLFVADSGEPKHVRVFDVGGDGSLSGGEVFLKVESGAPDGMRLGADGLLYVTSGAGVEVFSMDGVRQRVIEFPEVPANLCFGGRDGDILFVTARTGLYWVKIPQSE